MARRSTRKVTHFEPAAPPLGRTTGIESTFEVDRRSGCTMRIDCSELDPRAVIRPVPGEWQPHMPAQLDEVRVYTVTGVSHAPFRPLTKPVMQLPGNRLGYGAFMRALLVALFEWVEHGIAPPDSRFPSRTEGTLV